MAEKVLTISIRRYLSAQPVTKRSRKAVKYIRERIAHYTKTALENVKISMDLNSKIVKHYSKRMVPIKMSVDVEKGVAHAKLFEDASTAERAKRNEALFAKKFGKVMKKAKQPAEAPAKTPKTPKT